MALYDRSGTRKPNSLAKIAQPCCTNKHYRGPRQLFGLFKSKPTVDHLASAKNKLREKVSTHLRTLALKRQSGITVDAYGTPDASKWNAEAQYFVDKVWLPLLSMEERMAVLAAGLSYVAQELIEDRVRPESSRIHASGERDMSLSTFHPPDHTAGQRRLVNSHRRQATSETNTDLTRGLIIRDEPLERILSGQKTWEMRSSHTRVRGRIALIRKGSKTVIGVAEITGSKGPISDEQLMESIHLHGISAHRLHAGEASNYRYAWILRNVKRLSTPAPYQHKGGVIFVTLDDYARQAIADQLRGD